MLELTIILFFTLLIAFAVLHRTLFPKIDQTVKLKRLTRKGAEAPAILLDMHHTGHFVNNLPKVKLQIQVSPRVGRNFVAEIQEVLSFTDLEQLYIGVSLIVKYNPSNPKEVMMVK